jgi:glycosyltransferase involved in cell wall biosynthesis
MTLADGAICLHVEGAQNRQHFDRGIPRYVVEHAKAIHAAAPDSLHSVLLNPALPLTGNLDWLLGTGLLAWGSHDRRVAPSWAHLPAIYHVMCPIGGGSSLDDLWPPWARDPTVTTVVTLYDLIPLLFPDRYLHDPRQSAEYVARLDLIRHADLVLAISRRTADDAIERLGVDEDRVRVIHAGASDQFAAMYQSAAGAWTAVRLRFPGVRPGFMLYVGGFEFRKNLGGLIEGYSRLPAELRSEHQLVITCRLTAEQAAHLHDLGARAGLAAGQLVLTGYITDLELGALYHACALFVFASLYEGSGLPVLEAMSCGAPVAASNNSSVPEILGDFEATFDPADPASIATCLAETVGSPATLDRLRSRSRARGAGYTWDRVAELSIEAYRAAAERVSRRRPLASRRPRIALVTPWPPERSGVAVYNARLARELAALADLDVVVAEAAGAWAPIEPGWRIVDAAEFHAAGSLRQYDRVIYCMGNSGYHAHVFELLRERTGAVVLHDVRLTGFYGAYAGRECPGDPAGRLADRLRASYGSRHGSGLSGARAPDWAEQHAVGLYMTQEIQSLAETIFVHSRFAVDVLELDADIQERRAPVGLLPFGMPPATGQPRGAASGRPLIVSLGAVHESKGVAELIAGFAGLADSCPDARLVIAGSMGPEDQEHWRAHAVEQAPAADIEITGHLSAARYARLLATADVAVQLRGVSNGEASAAIADCLAAGLPTLVSDLGWARELPASTVSLLPGDATAPELAGRLLRLLVDVPLRSTLSSAGLAHARANSFAEVARAYLSALELA